MALKTAKTRWRDVILVCKKCQKKVGKGFGPEENLTLKKALTRYLQPEGKGRKSELAVMYVDCFDVCPKKAVTAVNAADPGRMIIVPAGADLIEVTDRLGLARRPAKRRKGERDDVGDTATQVGVLTPDPEPVG